MGSKELYDQAADLEKQVVELHKKAHEEHLKELRAKPIADRLVYSAYVRCPCGAGLAYDPAFEDENSVFNGPLSGYWDCSDILLKRSDPLITHTGKLPFAFYEIKSEQQPSAQGANTRTKGPRQEVKHG